MTITPQNDGQCVLCGAGEEVTFSEVVGMTELNGHPPIRVKNCKAHSFYLEVDSTNWRWG